jgi:pyrroloquinoline quinone (PQQ) biosynthesis protein C
MSSTFLLHCQSLLKEGDTLHHVFLKKIKNEKLSEKQFRIFLSHWYQMSKSHREAFPRLIANIIDDEVRFDLIGILYEEYGDGNRGMIHGKILERMLTALEINKNFALNTTPLIATTAFNDTVKSVWLNGEHAYAYGLHFGLEYLATEQQRYFSNGMLKYNFLSKHSREYFELHAEAEVRHVQESEFGFEFYAANPDNQKLLEKGTLLAKELLSNLWNEMDKVVFDKS